MEARATRTCKTCSSRVADYSLYCPACGSPLGCTKPGTESLRLPTPPVFSYLLGNILLAASETGRVSFVDVEGMKTLTELDLELQELLELRPLFHLGLLFLASRTDLVCLDLWHRIHPHAEDRTCRFRLEGELCSELVELRPGWVCFATRSRGGTLLNRFRCSRRAVVREHACAVAGLRPQAVVGIAVTESTLHLSEPGSSAIWGVEPEPAIRAQLEGQLAPNALQPNRIGLLALGSGGEVWLLDPTSAQERTQLAPPFDPPLYGWGTNSNWIILCHGRWVRAVHLETEQNTLLRFPQHCSVPPTFDNGSAYLASDEGSLYTLDLTLDQAQVRDYQPLFLSPGGTPISPIPYHGHLLCFGGGGELIRLHLNSRKSWTPAMLSDIT